MTPTQVKSYITSIFLTLIMAAGAFAQLDEAYEAHGGLQAFRNMGVVEYDTEMELGGGALKISDHQLIDLDSRKVLVTSGGYKIGFDGSEAWILPGMSAFPIPPRFYAMTPFYFFGLPFLFADPGVNLEPLGTKELGGEQFDAVKVTYDAGVGDTPDDNYVIYMDKDTRRIKLVHYIVTYPPLMDAETVDELERHAAVYDEWQEVNGMLVPKKITFYEWAEDSLNTEPVGYLNFEHVSFSEQNPDPALFSRPEGAEVDNSHTAR